MNLTLISIVTVVVVSVVGGYFFARSVSRDNEFKTLMATPLRDIKIGQAVWFLLAAWLLFKI